MDRCGFEAHRPGFQSRDRTKNEKGSVHMDLLEQLQQLTESCREDYNKSKGGNKAAGTRVRKTMQDVKNLAQEIRKEMLNSRED